MFDPFVRLAHGDAGSLGKQSLGLCLGRYVGYDACPPCGARLHEVRALGDPRAPHQDHRVQLCLGSQ